MSNYILYSTNNLLTEVSNALYPARRLEYHRALALRDWRACVSSAGPAAA